MSPERSPVSAPLMDIPALARRLAVTERHVRRLVAERRVPFLKVGRYVRFDPDRISAWVADSSVEAGRPNRRGRSFGDRFELELPSGVEP